MLPSRKTGVFVLSEPGYPKQDKLEKALATNLSTKALDAALQHAREVSRSKGIDKILKDYDLDVIIGPAESSTTDLASASGSWNSPVSSVRTDRSLGYPIASLPLGYLDFKGRPFGMAALALAHQEATLIKVQSESEPGGLLYDCASNAMWSPLSVTSHPGFVCSWILRASQMILRTLLRKKASLSRIMIDHRWRLGK